MPATVIQDWNQFNAFLAAQPLCQWAMQKQREIDSGMHGDGGRSPVRPPPPKNDNADLAAALSSMA